MYKMKENITRKFKTLFPLLLLFPFLFSCVLNPVDPTRFERLKTDAQAQYQSRDYAAALKTNILITEEFPNKEEGYTGIVQILVEKNIYDKAENVAIGSKGKIDDKAVSNLYRVIADGLYADFDYSKAEQFYKKAYELNNTDAYLRLQNLKVALHLGKLQDAKNYINFDKDLSDVYVESQLVNAILQLEELNAVTEFLNRLNEVEDLTSNSKLIADVKSFQEAVKIANENKDNSIYVSVLLAREYINLGYPNIALLILENKQAQFNNYYDGLYFTALSYYLSGDYGKAIEINNIIEAKGFDTYEIQLITARSYLYKGDITNFTKYYERAIQYTPAERKPLIMVEFASELVKQQQYSKSLLILNSAEKLEDSIELRKAYIELYFATKEYAKIPVHLEYLATKANSENDLSRFVLETYIDMYLLNSQFELAKEKLDALEKLGQTDPNFNLLSGRYYALTGDNKKAIQFYEQAINYDLQGEVSEKAMKFKEVID